MSAAAATHTGASNGVNAYSPRMSVRALPHNLDAEAGVIGGVILRNETLERVPDLEVDDFYDFKHKIVWQAIRNLEAVARPIDVVTLENEIERQGKLDAVGGIAFLGELALRVPTADNVEHYARDVQLLHRNRSAIIALSSALERAQSWQHDPKELVGEVAGELARIDADAVSNARNAYGSPFASWLGDTEPGNDPQDIFDVHGLIVRAEPCIILGDPKVGKTLLVEDLALHLASGRKAWCEVPIYKRCRVLALLREDSERTTRRRFFQMARGAGIERWELDGWLEVDGITPLYFDDPKHVAQLGRQLKNYDVVLIDSLSTIHNGDENSVESMAPVMNQWRDLSLTTKTAIVIIHHFRKRGDGNAAPQAFGSGVLQRARGSSIIGATTRHAVGISAGPERGQVVIEVESNHDIETEPFVVVRKSGTDEKGDRFLSHHRVGSLRDARVVADESLIDPITQKVLSQYPDGLGLRDLRSYVNEQMKLTHGTGIGGVRVDQSLKRLERRGHVSFLQIAKKWKEIR